MIKIKRVIGSLVTSVLVCPVVRDHIKGLSPGVCISADKLIMGIISAEDIHALIRGHVPQGRLCWKTDQSIHGPQQATRMQQARRSAAAHTTPSPQTHLTATDFICEVSRGDER